MTKNYCDGNTVLEALKDYPEGVRTRDLLKKL